MESKVELDDDLAEKLERLQLIQAEPAVFLNEYFAEIRNQIDYDAERLLARFDSEAATNGAKINSTRERFILILQGMEQSLLDRLPGHAAEFAEPTSLLEQRVERFILNFSYIEDRNKLEEAYSDLALDLMSLTDSLEGSLLGNQSAFYVPSKKEDQIGTLFYLSEFYLGRIEIASMKALIYNHNDFKRGFISDLYQALGSSMKVRVSLPMTVNINTLIIHGLLPYLNSPTPGQVKCFGSPKIRVLEPPNNEPKLVDWCKIYCAELLEKLFNQSIESVRLDSLSTNFLYIGRSNLSLYGNRLRNFEVDDSYFERLDLLDLSNNQLEAFNSDQLAKNLHLKELKMTNACLPDTRFEVGFLDRLPRLIQLCLTLPNITVDFSVFSKLTELRTLELHGAASLDANIKLTRLSREDIKHLFVSSFLEKFELTHFEIESLDQIIFVKRRGFSEIRLTNNLIIHIDQEAFRSLAVQTLHLAGNQIRQLPVDLIANQTNSSTLNLSKNELDSFGNSHFEEMKSCYTLKLNHNKIEQVPAEFFDRVERLDTLDLSYNSIRQIKRGTFSKLNKLILNHNPIDTIEEGSFEKCNHIHDLSLSGCKLTSLNNRTLNGITSLNDLNLNNNQIESLEVSSESGPIRGILSPHEYDMVKQRLFCDLGRLRKLSLQNNRLKKLDLNFFCNLTGLTDLDVSSNLIDELNKEIQPGTLAKLRQFNLSNNQLKFIDKNAFSQSIELVQLNLCQNRLQSLDEDFFEPFEKLNCLHLQKNQLSLTISDQTLARCLDLYYIDLSENIEIRFSERALEGLRRLEVLKTYLKSGLVILPHKTPVDRFEVVYPDVYDLIKIVEFTLAVYESDVTTIKMLMSRAENAPFLSITRNLSLVNSSIDQLDELNLGESFANLNTLDLSRNLIKTLTPTSLINLPNLATFNISENLLDTLESPGLFKVLPALQEINLSGNNLRKVHRRLFDGLDNLERLDLSKNASLSKIDCGIFRGLFNLKRLNLAGNNIAFFDLASLFRSCRLLECIDLSNNNLDHESINEDSMSGSTAQNLKELMLVNNRLESIDFVRNLYRLEKLDLSRNKIESVTLKDVNLFGRLMKLTILNLSDNQIKSFGKKVLDFFKQQSIQVKASNNPLDTHESEVLDKLPSD